MGVIMSVVMGGDRGYANDPPFGKNGCEINRENPGFLIKLPTFKILATPMPDK
jgi:hypothetical protein